MKMDHNVGNSVLGNYGSRIIKTSVGKPALLRYSHTLIGFSTKQYFTKL